MGSRRVAWLLILLLCFATACSLALSYDPPLEVTVATDKGFYAFGNLVKVFGNITYENETVTEGLVGIQIDNPEPSFGQLLMRTVPLGNLSSQQFLVRITSLTPCDLFGNPKQNFTLGQKAYFKVQVKNNDVAENDVLVTITVFDSTLVPLEVAKINSAIGAGETETLTAEVYIDQWASTGNAPVYANAYTDWPENDGRPYCPEKMANFTIKKLGEEPPNNPIPEQPVRNGSYQIEFHIPPEPLPTPYPARYNITSSAWYKGWQASSTTKFRVRALGDVDGDGDVDIYDIVTICLAYDSEEGDPNWVPEADIAEPYGKIDIYDVVTACNNYGSGT
jgi:hypothetical protein